MREERIAFPHCYKFSAKNKEQYEGYIQGFLNLYHPHLKMVRIEKYYVICVKK